MPDEINPPGLVPPFVALRSSLDALASGKKAIEPTRGNLVALVQTLANGLRPAMSEAVGKLDDGRAVIVDHAAVALLDDLAAMLRDLGLGRVDPALKRSPGGSGRAFVARDQRRRQALLDAVEIVKHHEKFETLEEAEAFLGERIRKLKPGLRVGGKPVNAERLKAWRNHSKEWK